MEIANGCAYAGGVRRKHAATAEKIGSSLHPLINFLHDARQSLFYPCAGALGRYARERTERLGE